LGSREFNEHPEPLELHGVRAQNRALFEKLESISDGRERVRVFNEYMSVKFYLHQWEGESDPARRAIKNSYLRLLRGWGVDSNSVEGAVLKGWVESRFGLVPSYHKGPLRQQEADDYTAYDFDRVRGSARTNSINDQLDLLFTFTQHELWRRADARPWVRLYRGVYDLAEHAVTERVTRREYYVKLNNLSSFTSVAERAWEFGTTVWAVEVPVCKVFFYGDLLPESFLRGEDEYLIIGGEYRVQEVA
jgi:NAD+--dinitrogen-reductase ADP-D-ribosyltransferase